MYCKKCGKQITEDAIFCSFCGSEQGEQVSMNGDGTQAQIVQRLKPYKDLKECTCLECGYKGLMGVVRKQKIPLNTRIIIWIIKIVVSYAVISVIGFDLLTIIIIAVIYVVIDACVEKKVLFCPSCCKELDER